MVQHATAAVSIAGSILLCLVFIGLVYDLMQMGLVALNFSAIG
jgi:hypothetical protein